MSDPGLRERIVQRLEGSQPVADPAAFELPGFEAPLPPALRRIRRDALTPAAVLIALVGEGDRLRVL
ncbi:MAG: hypothetical protein AAGD86_07740, partial [Pseudomonadota bacterium]